MFENAGEAITLGLFVNCLYDIAKDITPINKDTVAEYFNIQQINFNKQQAEQVVEVIEVKKLTEKIDDTDEDTLKQRLVSDEQVNQVYKSINPTYIQNQTNIGTQNNFSGNSRKVNTEGGKYVEGDNHETHYHYPKDETPKK